MLYSQEMTLLVHVLQYRLHCSEITDTNTKNNGQYQLLLSDYWYISKVNTKTGMYSVQVIDNIDLHYVDYHLILLVMSKIAIKD